MPLGCVTGSVLSVSLSVSVVAVSILVSVVIHVAGAGSLRMYMLT